MGSDHENRIAALEAQYKRLKTIIDITDDSDKKTDLIVDLLWHVEDWRELKQNVLKKLPELLTAINDFSNDSGTRIENGITAPPGQLFCDQKLFYALESLLYDIGLRGD